LNKATLKIDGNKSIATDGLKPPACRTNLTGFTAPCQLKNIGGDFSLADDFKVSQVRHKLIKCG